MIARVDEVGVVQPVGPPKGPGKGRGSGRSRERLLDAALTLGAHHGIDSTSVDQIAERAGVAKGTVYYNFGSKDNLYRTLLVTGLHTIRDEMASASEGLKGREAIGAMIATILQRISDNPDRVRILLAEIWRSNRPWFHDLVAARGEVTAQIARALLQGIERGEIRVIADVELAAHSIFASTTAASLDRSVSAAGDSHGVAKLLEGLMSIHAPRP